MLSNFFKIAFRNLARHKGFSFINLSGLTLGLTACLLIGLFVRDERSYDKFVPHGDRIYRIYNQKAGAEGGEKMVTTPPMIATALQQEFPEVDLTLRVMKISSKDLFEAGDKKFYEEGGVAADSTFFDMFPLRFVHGSREKVLYDPASIVISESMAERFFGKENPVGRELLFNKTPLVVKGVYQQEPKFHLQLNYIIPMSGAGLPPGRLESWGWQQMNNYVRVREGATGAALQQKFQDWLKVNVHPLQRAEDDDPSLLFFQPLHQVHLYSASFKNEWLAVRGNITYVRALTIIAVFILLIACFNFVNLATAQSLKRAREVGVRKTIGASRGQLMLQYLAETILLAFISSALSILLTFLLLPWLNQFTEKHIVFDIFTNPAVMLLFVALTVVLGLLAGFYPALVLSGFQPVDVLKGSGTPNTKPGQVPWLRHSLVVLQFALSAILIISAIVVIRQVHFLHNKDLGLNKDQIMFFPMRGDKMYQDYETFKTELQRHPGIASVSIGYGFPGDIFAGEQVIVPHAGEQKVKSVTMLMGDHDYIKTMGVQLVAGRDFSRSMASDPNAAFIINETAVKEFGFGTPENAVGKTVYWSVWGASQPDSMKVAKVIGVAKDFHYKSLYDQVEPAVLQIFPPANWKVAVKMKAAQLDRSVAHVESVWRQFSPDYPIEYSFLDESFAVMYKSEDKLKTLLWIFTALTIFVACLGLLGLAAYAAERRKKEIGIRKVLGSSVEGLVLLLSKDFVRLVTIAMVIAAPVAWYFMNGWLQDFAYRVELSWWIFILAAVVSILIALVTVSFQAVKAALSNPVKNLRTE